MLARLLFFIVSLCVVLNALCDSLQNEKFVAGAVPNEMRMRTLQLNDHVIELQMYTHIFACSLTLLGSIADIAHSITAARALSCKATRVCCVTGKLEDRAL